MKMTYWILACCILASCSHKVKDRRDWSTGLYESEIKKELKKYPVSKDFINDIFYTCKGKITVDECVEWHKSDCELYAKSNLIFEKTEFRNLPKKENGIYQVRCISLSCKDNKELQCRTPGAKVKSK